MYRETENISRHFFLFSSFGKFIRNKHVPLGTAIRRFGQLSKGRYIQRRTNDRYVSRSDHLTFELQSVIRKVILSLTTGRTLVTFRLPLLASMTEIIE